MVKKQNNKTPMMKVWLKSKNSNGLEETFGFSAPGYQLPEIVKAFKGKPNNMIIEKE